MILLHFNLVKNLFYRNHEIYDIINNLFVEIDWTLEQDYYGNYDYISGNFDQLTSASRIYCFNRSAGAARDATSMSMLWTGDLA